MGLPVLSEGEQVARQILSEWKEGDVATGCIAATELGWLSDKVLTDSRCYHLLKSLSDFQKNPGG